MMFKSAAFTRSLCGFNLNQLRWSSMSMSMSTSPIRGTPIDRDVVRGKASPAGTLEFIRARELPLQHQFTQSSLRIHVVIHGPPKAGTLMSKEEADRNIVKAIIHNHSNAIFVYDHRNQDEGGPWYSNVLVPLINEHRAVSRDQLVVMAALGDIKQPNDISVRLQEARKLSGVEHIDIAQIEWTYNPNNFEESLGVLGESLDELGHLCENGHLQSFGIHSNFPPYCFHNPPSTLEPSLIQFAPMILESELKENHPFADLVSYTISPSHHTPATYCMLPSMGDFQLNIEMQEVALRDGINAEQTRRYSRAAMHPFLCMRGWGQAVDKASNCKFHGIPSTAVSLISGSSQMSEEDERAMSEVLNKLCPPLAQSKRLQEKALRLVLSVGVDVTIVDSRSSVQCGSLVIAPEHLLSWADSQSVFGRFAIPEISNSVSREQ